ncbi:Auxin-responsive protein SAUR40 [Carex littledalei]|uniref:Auxin-responsive protein SAUR40 n=1 Tax=Carex littledalei TaxID=544730 RepID=A0A833VCD0_9POAL|nr:Auxin-responsive protein SAUR40 [Carex littledalei]
MITCKSCFSILSPLLRKVHWMKKERRAPNFLYRIQSSFIKKTPKGFVPIIVGDDDMRDVEERFLVHVKLLSKPCMVDLLELAVRQFGYGQEGVLRVPCDVRHFQKVLDSLEKVA